MLASVAQLVAAVAHALTSLASAPPPVVPLAPIDATFSACVEVDPSTAGQIRCAEEALASWDAELNDAYRALRDALPADAAEELQRAQRAWLAFRDAEFLAIDALYDQKEGTMYLPMRVIARVELVTTRAEELQGALELLRDE